MNRTRGVVLSVVVAAIGVAVGMTLFGDENANLPNSLPGVLTGDDASGPGSMVSAVSLPADEVQRRVSLPESSGGEPGGPRQFEADRVITLQELPLMSRPRALTDVALFPDASTLLEQCRIASDEGSVDHVLLSELDLLIEASNTRIQKAQANAFNELSSWAIIKGREQGGGIEGGTAAARALSRAARDAGHRVISMANGPSGKGLVVEVIPGEYAPADVAYDDAWFVVHAEASQLQAFIDSHF